MKRILYISPTNIGKRAGGGLASLAFYNATCRNYPGMVDLCMPQEFCEGPYLNAIGVPRRNLLCSIKKWSLHRFKGFLKVFLAKNKSVYDIIIINGGLYAGDLVDLSHQFGLKVVVIHHNFEREYHLDNKSVLTFWGRTSFLVDRNERRAYMKADINCFLTPEDAEAFKKYYGKTVTPYFIIGVFEPNNFDLPPVVNKRKNTIVITGSMNSVQTMMGIKDFRVNYYDIIQRLCNDWELIVAGRNPQQDVYDLQEMNPNYISIIPNPINMDDITKEASIFICPTNVGGGLKLRLMDGLRQGLPVLVHKVSARGYESFIKEPFFKVYYDRPSFENGLKEILEYCDNSFDRQLIQNEYADQFSFNSGCKKIQQVIEAAANS